MFHPPEFFVSKFSPQVICALHGLSSCVYAISRIRQIIELSDYQTFGLLDRYQKIGRGCGLKLENNRATVFDCHWKMSGMGRVEKFSLL